LIISIIPNPTASLQTHHQFILENHFELKLFDISNKNNQFD
jgi:hypothetical protein